MVIFKRIYMRSMDESQRYSVLSSREHNIQNGVSPLTLVYSRYMHDCTVSLLPNFNHEKSGKSDYDQIILSLVNGELENFNWLSMFISAHSFLLMLQLSRTMTWKVSRMFTSSRSILIFIWINSRRSYMHNMLLPFISSWRLPVATIYTQPSLLVVWVAWATFR